MLDAVTKAKSGRSNNKVNAWNTISKPKTKQSFVIVNIHHIITEDETKAVLKNNLMNVGPTNKTETRDYRIKQSSQCSSKTLRQNRLAAIPM